MQTNSFDMYRAPKDLYMIIKIKGKRLKKKMRKLDIIEGFVVEKRSNSKTGPVWLFNGTTGVFVSKKHAKNMRGVKIG